MSEREQTQRSAEPAYRGHQDRFADVMGPRPATASKRLSGISTSLREASHSIAGPFVSIDTLLAWARPDSTLFRENMMCEKDGHLQLHIMKLVTHAFNMMTGFNRAGPSRSPVCGIHVYAVWCWTSGLRAGRYFLQGTTVAGFPFLASVIAIFSGAQLFALG